MKHYRFWWDDQNIEHIADHGVEPHEAEAALIGAWLIRIAGQGKYAAYGQTMDGRYLLVIFAPKDDQRVRVVTARDLSSREKRRFRTK